MNVERSFAQQHYADLSDKPFFPGLVEYIISGPVVAMVWEGKDVVATGRRIIGATRPWEAAPGTIRGDYAVEVGRSNTLTCRRHSCWKSYMISLFNVDLFRYMINNS
jgi:nucleoside-diphosphate kinase